LLTGSNFPCELHAKILSLRKVALHLVAGRRCDAKQERFQLAHVSVIDREINAEPIPQAFVTITKMSSEARRHVLGEANVIEPFVSVESVYAVTTARVLLDDVLVELEDIARQTLEVLRHKWGVSVPARGGNSGWTFGVEIPLT
jgi:hypothetical protein